MHKHTHTLPMLEDMVPQGRENNPLILQAYPTHMPIGEGKTIGTKHTHIYTHTCTHTYTRVQSSDSKNHI